jgi:hypothetical protein
MLLYIAGTNRVVSVVPVVERKEQSVQRPVYHLSEVLSQSKQNCPHYRGFNQCLVKSNMMSR